MVVSLGYAGFLHSFEKCEKGKIVHQRLSNFPVKT